MGAWGHGLFENDDAADLESRVAATGTKAIETALAPATLGDLTDDEACAAALAACEIIAAARGFPMRGFAGQAVTADAWLKESAYRPTERLRTRAARVTTHILDGSGLADLWRESGDLSTWKRAVQSLARRLEKPAKDRVPAKRSKAKPRKTKGRKTAAHVAPHSPRTRETGTAVISSIAAKQLLVKKADGWLEGDDRGSGVTVSLRLLSKLTQADARGLATLPEVRRLELGGMKLSGGQRVLLQMLLDGWSGATVIEADGTTGVAAMLCANAATLADVTTLDLSGSDVTDGDLQSLSGHPTLEHLVASSTAITDSVFRLARAIPRLRSLQLIDCPRITIPAAAAFASTDGHADRLHYHPHPSQVGLSEPTAARQQACSKHNRPMVHRVAGTWKVWVSFVAGHVAFGELPDLDRLGEMARECLVDSVSIGINLSPIRNETAERLRFALTAWPGICGLSIACSQTLDDSIANAIGKLDHLESLEVRQASIGDATITALAGLKNLRQLTLDQTRVTKKCLPTIARLRSLRWLQLSPSPKLPLSAIETLRHELRKRCYVECLKSAR